MVQTAGAQVVSKFGRMDKGPTSVWEAPNALFVTGNDGESTVATLRRMVAEHHRPAAADRGQPREPLAGDPADQIRKYAALRDDGIISEEEFQAKKHQLLGL